MVVELHNEQFRSHVQSSEFRNTEASGRVYEGGGIEAGNEGKGRKRQRIMKGMGDIMTGIAERRTQGRIEQRIRRMPIRNGRHRHRYGYEEGGGMGYADVEERRPRGLLEGLRGIIDGDMENESRAGNLEYGYPGGQRQDMSWAEGVMKPVSELCGG